jgi:hypothetical protein
MGGTSIAPPLLTLTLDGGKWPTSCFTPWESGHGTHCICDWLGLTADLDIMERKKSLASTRNRTQPLCRPASSLCHYTGYSNWYRLHSFNPKNNNLRDPKTRQVNVSPTALYRISTFQRPYSFKITCINNLHIHDIHRFSRFGSCSLAYAFFTRGPYTLP